MCVRAFKLCLLWAQYYKVNQFRSTRWFMTTAILYLLENFGDKAKFYIMRALAIKVVLK